jgi:hypothetical protein
MAETFTPELVFGQYSYGTLADPAQQQLYKTIRVSGLGPELNGDPSFDNPVYWNAGAGWVVSGGAATATAATAYLSKLIGPPPTVGLTYRIVIVVTSYSGGTVQGYVGTSPAFTPTISAIGTFSYDVLAVAGGELGIIGQGFTGVVSDLSIKQVL